MKKIKIAIAEDHHIFRNTLVNMLDGEEDISVVFDVANGRDLIDGVKENQVDVVILDLDLPIMNGRKALSIIKQNHPQIKVLILSMHYTDYHIQTYMALGANGYLSKDCDFETFLDAINNVYYNDFHFDDKISPKTIQKIILSKFITPKFFKYESLSKREIEVLQLICLEKTSSEIADRLIISQRTVDNHRKHLMKKTGARNSVGLLTYAILNGFHNLDI
tara:strand:- start:131 stop:790 length:660 start_codon:yes stop_codon:yes gene_type:complete